MEKMSSYRGFKVPAFTLACLPADLKEIDCLIDAYERAQDNDSATYKLAAKLAEYGVRI